MIKYKFYIIIILSLLYHISICKAQKVDDSSETKHYFISKDSIYKTSVFMYNAYFNSLEKKYWLDSLKIDKIRLVMFSIKRKKYPDYTKSNLWFFSYSKTRKAMLDSVKARKDDWLCSRLFYMPTLIVVEMIFESETKAKYCFEKHKPLLFPYKNQICKSFVYKNIIYSVNRYNGRREKDFYELYDLLYDFSKKYKLKNKTIANVIKGQNKLKNNIQFKNSIKLKNKDEAQMIFVKGGTFTMGSNNGQDDEKPPHQVTVSDFYIGKYEVTQKQWKDIMGTNPSYFKGDNRPIENVSWNDIQKFLRKLNRKTGKKYRLPTEAEWEYAASGGHYFKQTGLSYSGSNNIDEVAWYIVNSRKKGYLHKDYGIHPVGQKKPNQLGLYDMCGNVWEWCSDWYGDSYYKNSSIKNPKGASNGHSRVLRGGSWNDRAYFCRLKSRWSLNYPRNNYNGIGFRLVRTK